MDKIEQYRQIIKNILSEDASIQPGNENIEPQLIFDDERSNYQLMYIGWTNDWRMHGAVIHARLRNGKIYIEAGVPKEDIFLAFHAPWKRPYTEFAVV